MPPKKNKNQLNGFWLYAQKNKPRWKAQGLRVGTNDELLAIAHPLWKSLDVGERKEWDRRAKEERQLRKGEVGDMGRLDNVGNVIGERRDPAEEARKRREAELRSVTSQWEGKDLTQERFYFINFQDMCELTDSDNTVEREFLPRELAMVEYSLKQGIIQYYHQFIWPGDIPVGFRFQAEKVSEEFHKIPAHKTDDDSDDYPKIWQKMLKVVKAGVKNGIYPPLYCLTQDYDKIKYLCDWMWMRGAMGAGNYGDNPLGKIYSIEDLVVALLAKSGKPGTERVARSQITSRLDGSQWEFIPATTCDFHKENDVSRFCALAVVRRTAYTMSDMVGLHYDVNLTERHVPVREEEDNPGVARILPPGSVPMYNGLRRGGGANLVPSRGRSKPTAAAMASRGGSYSQMARPGSQSSERPGMSGTSGDDDEEDEEEFTGRFMPQPRRMQPKPNKLISSQSVMMRYNEVPAAPPGPTSGQFDDSDWPTLGGGGSKASKQMDEDFPSLGGGMWAAPSGSGSQVPADYPALQMSQMTLASASSVLMDGEGRGATAASSSPPGVTPPPGFGGRAGVGRASPPDNASSTVTQPPPVGRGMPPAFGRGSSPPSVGRGAMPSVGRGAIPTVGRGEVLGVGRGTMPPVGRGEAPFGRDMPSVGRGAMPVVGRGAAPGFNSADFPGFGRGDMPLAGRGAAPQMGVASAPSCGRGDMPSVGRGAMPSVGRGRMPGETPINSNQPSPAKSTAASSPAKSVSGNSLCYQSDASAFADDFEPLPSNEDFPSLQSGRGVAPGRGAGPSVGRGYIPSRGRGSAPQVGRGSMPPRSC